MTPEGWSVATLKEIGTFSKGSGIKKDDVLEVGIPCIRYGQIYTEFENVIKHVRTFVSGTVAKSSRQLSAGEILFAGSGETKEEIGKCVAYVEDVGAVAGGDIVILTPKGANSCFLGFALNAYDVVVQKTERAQGDAVVHISASSLATIQVLLPPLPEQQAIAEALSDADALVESLDALIAKKRDMKQAAMQQLLTGRTRLPGFSNDWQENRLGELLNYEQPTRYLVQSAEYESEGTTPVLTAGKSFILGYTSETEGVYDKGPTILFDDFTTATQWVDFPFKVKSSACKMLTSRDPAVSLRFVYEMMATISYVPTDHMRHWIGIASHWSVAVPRPAEQLAIAEVLADMDAEIDALVAQREKAELEKQGMMQELLSGRVRLV